MATRKIQKQDRRNRYTFDFRGASFNQLAGFKMAYLCGWPPGEFFIQLSAAPRRVLAGGLEKG